MEFLNIPPTVLVGYAVSLADIERTLKAAGFKWPVRYFTWVQRAPRSIRIFSVNPIAGSGLLPEPMDLQGMIHELISLAMTGCARYDLQTNPKSRKGWEIREGRIGDTPILVALAAWV
jgi:hypothetical protein